MNPFHFFRRNLRGRIIFLVGLGMITLAGILWVSHLWESQELLDQALNERQHLAQVLANHLDFILKTNLALLQDATLNIRVGLEGEGLISVKTALREAYLHSIFTEGVFLLDQTGKMVWMEPQRPSREQKDLFPLPPAVLQGLRAGKLEMSDLVTEGKKRIYAMVPMRDWKGKLIGAVGGELDPENPRFRSLLYPIRLGKTTYLELVDSQGIVLISTRGERAFIESDHGRFLANLVQKKRSVVGTCHSCHAEEEPPEREREIIAFAPLLSAPWGVSIRQSEKEALAPVFTMERRLLVVGSLTILIALLFAWGVAGSVTRPLGILTQGAQQITKGDLDESIPPLGADEIGRLAHSFDQMRMALKTSLETIAEGKRDLEKRVQERTRELENLYRELQEKEEMRGELLKKVITAQEEERKRIARELHDETSQALATLLLSMETSISTTPEEIKEQLFRMRAMADRTLDSIHRLIFDLRPSILDDLGLPSALRWSAENHLETKGIDLSFVVIGLERRLAPEIETTLFRIGQEAITNIVRHAEAESVRITIEFGEKMVRLQVRDDGKGFKPEEVVRPIEESCGLGLLGMKERATLLGGTLTIYAEPEKGTQVSVDIPMAENCESKGGVRLS